MKSEELLNNLEKYKPQLIESLSVKKWRHFRLYFLIREKYLKKEIDVQFKKNFCNFYIMNGARGLNDVQKDKFFEILSSGENNLEKIIGKLFDVEGYNGSHRLFFSFGTKMLHTIDNNLPIYDGNVAEVLMLSEPIQSSTQDQKIKNRVLIYEGLKCNFRSFLKNTKIINYLRSIRREIIIHAKKDNFAWRDDLISNAKLLDSLLWALYPIIKEKITENQKKWPKLTKEESKALKEQSEEGGFLRKYIKWGIKRNLQIGLVIHFLAGKAASNDKNKAVELHKKALIYHPNLVYITGRFRKSVGLPTVTK